MPRELHVDVLIFGGGIAGLWTLARLRKEGYSCVLLEYGSLGGAQTIASQGIIHGGIKYALTGQASAASRAIAEMPAIWRACLEGTGEVDLRSVKILSECQYLWTTSGIGSRIAGVAASKVIRTPVRSVSQADRPIAFSRASRGVDVYAVDEIVLDPRSLVETLAHQTHASLARVSDRALHGADGKFVEHLTDGPLVRLDSHVHLRPRRLVFTAGMDNYGLANWIGLDHSFDRTGMRQQRRPLHMVMARGNLPPICGHCVGMSDKPRVTITSQSDSAGRTIWYIGGEVAESGVGRTRLDQIAEAKKEVAACMPWIDLGQTEWATLEVTRAEGVFGDAKNQRPDEPTIAAIDNAIFAYPTKLAFAPLLAARILEQLKGLPPMAADLSILNEATRPNVADLPWDGEHVKWT